MLTLYAGQTWQLITIPGVIPSCHVDPLFWSDMAVDRVAWRHSILSSCHVDPLCWSDMAADHDTWRHSILSSCHVDPLCWSDMAADHDTWRRSILLSCHVDPLCWSDMAVDRVAWRHSIFNVVNMFEEVCSNAQKDKGSRRINPEVSNTTHRTLLPSVYTAHGPAFPT